MMISRSEIRVNQQDRRETSSSSKGNQIKWFKDGYWLKANTFGYEDLAEWFVSELLKLSTLGQKEYITYDLCSIIEEDRVWEGCVSKNFTQSGDLLITFSRLFEMNLIEEESLFESHNLSDRIALTIDTIYQLTGLDVTDYLRKVFTLDALIWNEDRHLNNLAVIYNDESGFRICPIFDNGLSLLSDTSAYPIYTSNTLLLRQVKAKPFSQSFKEQMQVVGNGMRIDRKQLIEFIKNHQQMLGRIPTIMETSISMYPEVFI